MLYLVPASMILMWVLVLGVFAFVLMGYDNVAAKVSSKRRVREKNLWLVAAIGGFAGVGLGALVFHHKVAKWSFWPPVLLSIIAWLVLLYSLRII